MKPRATFRYLLHCDSAQSVLGGPPARSLGYECFGWRATDGTLQLAFNGVVCEPAGGYLLGNGYRLYSPVLRRFCSPDNLSPFKDGGINAYVYCKAEPTNASDPSGHIRFGAKFSRGFAGGRARGLPQTGKPQQTLPTIKEYEAFNKKPDVFRHLNDRESWIPLRNRHANLKKKIGRAFDNGVPEPVMNNRVDRALAELADIEHQFAGMFGEYRIQNGISWESSTGKSLPGVLKTVGHDQFALNVTLQELNAIKPIFSAASARQFISSAPRESMNALRKS